MSSHRVYSLLKLAYSGTRLYTSNNLTKQNVPTDKDYQPPILNHPTCIDSTTDNIGLSLGSLSAQSVGNGGLGGGLNQFAVTAMLTEAYPAPVLFTGRIDFKVAGTSTIFSVTFIGSIPAGTLQVTVLSTLTNQKPGPTTRSGIINVTANPVTGKTIVNNSPY